MPFKVLLLSHLYPSAAYPALGPFVRDQAVELSRRNRLTVVSPLKAWTGSQRACIKGLPVESEEDGLRVVRPKFSQHIRAGSRVTAPPLWGVRLAPILRREAKKLGGADVVHAHFAVPDGFAGAYFARRAGLPFVLTVWGSDVLVHGGELVSRSFVASALRRAAAVIAVSAQLADRVIELGAAPSRVHMVAGGVPYRTVELQGTARAALRVSGDVRLVLWIGGLVPVKQPLDAVAAFAELADPRARLVMAGDGPLRAEIEKAVGREGLEQRVRLLGHVDRETLWRWQCAADLLINTSRSEGTPFAVLEAMGAGVRVAGYPLPGIRAAVDAVSGGLMADEATPRSLAAAIREALASVGRRDSLAEAARERYSISRVSEALEAVYEKVAVRFHR